MSARWYVTAVQPKSEAFARVNLVRQGFEVYAPMIRVRRTVDRKTYVVPAPMFPGYLLVRFDQDTDRWRSINGTRGVIKLLPLHAEFPHPIPDSLVKQWLDSEIDGAVSLDDAMSSLVEYQRGQALRVVDGAFSGFPATCRSSSKGRVTLLMGLFGRETVVELSMNEVELAADEGTASAVAIQRPVVKSHIAG
ncbi:transcriptional activator RfaH [Telmatospirillum sp.]|uniref:transcription termination/antitermination protein NusG n=1 Tax=Telmatospirillum sp. TaxID=2079197 RepID=UPI0028401405|nr:transcriptional activator RfaH [Telmatospirillum sp.]MDR3439868.1 transcriptional activator RfaH [Telmatospirillum sp.]